jgi:hypothetical protein
MQSAQIVGISIGILPIKTIKSNPSQGNKKHQEEEEIHPKPGIY